MGEAEKRTLKLDADQFSVDESGKVTIDNEKLAEIIRHQVEEVDEDGSVKVSVSVEVS